MAANINTDIPKLVRVIFQIAESRKLVKQWLNVVYLLAPVTELDKQLEDGDWKNIFYRVEHCFVTLSFHVFSNYFAKRL